MYIYLISRELPLRKQVIHAQRSFSYFRPVEAQASHGAENTKIVGSLTLVLASYHTIGLSFVRTD